MKAPNRTGQYVTQPEGHKAFIPKPLPPQPPIAMDPELTLLLSGADQALARLDGITITLPNPNLFVFMYVRHESVLSSQIEGTQSSMDDLLKYETQKKMRLTSDDVAETWNHVEAMNYGLERLKSFPLSLRLIREIHEKLLQGVRGQKKTPGDFRRSQNWVGGSSPQNAVYNPPPVHEMNTALDHFEKYLHQNKNYPILIECGLIHVQFETIHPFLDGNGRVGRLLITFLLCQRGILKYPLLYLSHYFKQHRQEYYNWLMKVRNEGDWEGWLKFFLQGIIEVSQQAQETAVKILALQTSTLELIAQKPGSSKFDLELFNHLFNHPYIKSADVQQLLGCSPATAIRILNNFENLKILEEITGTQRKKMYRFSQYLNLFRP
ncbi:MAG: Fic family protein [Nitrospinota bacterium]|nr:Fic family protein [Nitrospinota bacterium]